MADPQPYEDEQLAPSRFVVGIDLGTTNSAVCYVDTGESPWQVRTFAVPQLVDAGQVEPRETLPSFHYQPGEEEVPEQALRLPWSASPASYAVGTFARDRGGLSPGRLIASAKSWLCHTGVDRTAELLPWHASTDVERLSPVSVSARYLRHIREAWDAAHPAEPLEKQDLVLTLPASFDEVARELTVQAAAEAGLQRVVLIEEPQAAFYAWIHRHRDNWHELVTPGQKILVCDIGGGTSDFTLIRVRQGEQGKVQFHRVAVGEHLILGGDNLDLALAHHLERKLNERGTQLEPRQWDVLVRTCRHVKEILLGADAPAQYTVHLPGSGAKLIGGGLQVEVTAEEVERVLLDGFFPRAKLDEKPAQRRSGFQEFGLPYAADAAITRYIAAFLTAHRHVAEEDAGEAPAAADPARPDVLLFNGGLFASNAIRLRLQEVIRTWFNGEQPDWQPQVLDNDRLDLAVARGAAYYGMVRRGEGVRIAADLARSYYIGVESEPPAAVCLVPGTAQPGQDIRLERPQFSLLVSQPVEFPLYVSSVRLADQPGEVLPIDREQMKPLPPIRTALRTRRRSETGPVAVQLHGKLTEIGTLELWCSQVHGDRQWRLQFDVRAATQTDVEARGTEGEQAGVVDEETWRQCQQVIADVFGPEGKQPPERLVKQLAAATELDRRQWPPSLLRRIWEELMELEKGRRKSAVHEARWLNLLGYALRPGYGVAVDDYRVTETWRTVQGKLAHHSPASRTESLILWRRIAGGLSAGQQRAVAEPLLSPLRAIHRRSTTGKGKSADPTFAAHESLEAWRLLGSLELLNVALKIEMGDMVRGLIPKRKMQQVRPALFWAVGRFGARVPVYGPLNTVVPLEATYRWLDSLLDLDESLVAGDTSAAFAVVQLARRTQDRYRDISPKWRDRVLAWLEQHAAPDHWQQLVREGGQLDQDEQGRVFGEALPKGLRIA